MRIQKILVLRNFYLRFYHKNEKEIYNVNVFVCYAENLITLYISFFVFYDVITKSLTGYILQQLSRSIRW